ncbi:hypothetical protein LSH36_960g00026 [Paralvinella palmiformis]|uniref:Uncharacterized protein n=1 Tax=Paralvinella palmiformis TaxID=53620 RepID=A0AAD9IY27_9ANNE|nr:hypothetical protein LSH36_960g00026 [Paralvinella palmiformis]
MSKKYRQAFKDTLCACFLPSTVRGRRFKRQMGLSYDRSGTCETYTQATCARYAPNRQNLTQCSPLINKSPGGLPKQFSDISEDEVTHNPDLCAHPDDLSCRNKGDRSYENQDRCRKAINGRYQQRTPGNGTICGDSLKMDGIQRYSPDEHCYTEDDIEMTVIRNTS